MCILSINLSLMDILYEELHDVCLLHLASCTSHKVSRHLPSYSMDVSVLHSLCYLIALLLWYRALTSGWTFICSSPVVGRGIMNRLLCTMNDAIQNVGLSEHE